MDRNLQFMDGYLENGYIFFSASNFNGLFRVKIGNTEAEFLGHFEEEFLWQTELHRQVISIADKIYFVPFKGRGISIYEKNTGKMFFVEIKEKKEVPIARAILIKKDIFMIPVSLECPFILFHSESNTYEILWDLWKVYKEMHPLSKDFFFGMYSVCISDENIYMKGAEGIILCANILDWNVHICELPKKYKFRNMYYDDGNIYITLSDLCKVVCWNCYTNKWKEYPLSHIEDIDFHAYMVAFRWKEYLILMPDRTNHILVLDKKKNEWFVQSDYIPQNFNRIKKQENLFLGYGCLDDKILLYPQAGNGMVILEKEKGTLCKIRYSDKIQDMVDEIGVKYMEKQITEDDIIYENNNIGTNLKSLISTKNFFEKHEKINKSVEKNIWKYCKG